jgi:mono/diheme cytochrome c family protein
MPNLRLSDDVRQALVAYLAALKGQADAEARPWNDPSAAQDSVGRGHILFNTVGCVTCHGVGGIGGYPNNTVAGGLIPSLKGVSESYTKKELIQRISLGAQPARDDPNGPQPMLSMPPWGQTLKPDEIEASPITFCR